MFVIWGSPGHYFSAEGCCTCWSVFWACSLLSSLVDLAGKLRVLQTNFLPWALHAVEASWISFSLLQSGRTAFVAVVWSKRMPLAHDDAVLSLLDGPPGYDPGFHVWCRFRFFCWYQGCNPIEVPRLHNLLDLVAGRVSWSRSFSLSSRKCWYYWGSLCDPLNSGWARPGLLVQQHLAGPYQPFKAAVWDACRIEVCLDFCRRQGFRGGDRCLTLLAPFNSNMHRMLQKGKRNCSRASWLGACGRNFSWVMTREKSFHAVFCDGSDGDGHLFWECLHSPLVQIQENPQFHDLLQRDEKIWPKCLFEDGWLPAFEGLHPGGGWVACLGWVAAHLLESRLGGCVPCILEDRACSDEFCCWYLVCTPCQTS